MEPAWIIAGIAFLGLVGGANAWMIRRIDKVREDCEAAAEVQRKEERDARHNLRNELLPMILSLKDK